MNEPIGITPAELWHVALALCGAIMTLSGAIAVIINLVNKMKQPEKIQNERLDKCEKTLAEIDARLKLGNTHFDKDEERLDKLEQELSTTTRVILESLQALTAHAIDGNNTDALKHSKHLLDEYLINKI